MLKIARTWSIVCCGWEVGSRYDDDFKRVIVVSKYMKISTRQESGSLFRLTRYRCLHVLSLSASIITQSTKPPFSSRVELFFSPYFSYFLSCMGQEPKTTTDEEGEKELSNLL